MATLQQRHPRAVGRFTGPPNPCEVDESRKIPDEPLFKKDEVEAVLATGGIKTVTKDCSRDGFYPDFSDLSKKPHNDQVVLHSGLKRNLSRLLSERVHRIHLEKISL